MNRIFLETPDGINFDVFLSPGAKKEEFTGLINGGLSGLILKISVHEKPTENRANDALIKFLSKNFCTPKNNILLRRGNKCRNKQFSILDYSIKKIPNELSQKLVKFISQIPIQKVFF